MSMIDCFLIGHNEMRFDNYEKSVRKMGINSGAYRDLNKNILQYNNTIYPIADLINFCGNAQNSDNKFQPFNMLETHSNAIAYLGTYLQRRGLTFDYVNSFQDDQKYLIEKLKQNQILTIAVITTLYVSVFPILEIMALIKKYNSTAKILVGGPFVATNIRTQSAAVNDYIFESIGADIYVNSSQGEATLVKIISALKNNAPLQNINNLHLRTAHGYKSTPVLSEDNKLYENTVDWSLFADRVNEHVAVRTAISCPYKCAFCGFPEHAGAYQTTEVSPIIEELDSLVKIQSLKSVHFVDDTFNIPKDRFKELLRQMVKKKYGFKWHSYYRCQFADDETMDLMRESGCEGVFLGIESGSSTILKNMDKAATADQYRKGIELLKKYDISTFGSFIIGFPGETYETVQETVDFIEQTELDFYRTQQWYLEPITPIWRQKEKYGITGESFEWSHRTMDSQTACDIIDENFLQIKNSIWMPQYNFDFDNALHLLHRGWSMTKIKEFIKTFNLGVRDKLTNPENQEVNPEILATLLDIYSDKEVTQQPAQPEHAPVQQNFDISFNF